jgi:phage terminase large subunit-like protein
MTTASAKLEPPSWLVEKYGLEKAYKFYEKALDRWHLITFNSHSDPRLIHKKQVDFLSAILFGDWKEYWWIGGNRTGKTELGAAAVSCVATGIVPWCVGGSGFEDTEKNILPQSIWITSLDFSSGRDIILPKLERYVPRGTLGEPFRKADQIFRFQNGSEIGLKSADSGREKFQGVSRNVIWLDEEPPEEIYDECLARTIDCGGKIMCTMTPLNGLSWSHDRIWQMQDEDSDLFVMHSTMEENPFLPRKEIARFRAKVKDTKIRDARLKGLYTLMKGAHVFDIETVSQMMDLCTDPIREDRTTGLKVWEEPQDGIPYVIGADIGKGKAKGDFSYAVVGDLLNRNIVATMRKRVDAESFAVWLEELGRHYNTALLVPESNDHGIVAINHLKKCAYPKIWRRKKIGKLGKQTLPELGFSTDVIGKPLLVAYLNTAIDNRHWHIPDKVILEEATTFIHYDDKIPTDKERHKTSGRCGAIRGKNDDGLIAFGLMLVGAHEFNRFPRTVPRHDIAEVVGQRSEARQRGGPVIINHQPYKRKIRRLGG